MATSKKSKAANSDTLTLFPQECRVNPIRRRVRDEASATTAISGLKLCELLKRSGPDGFFLRMLLGYSRFYHPIADLEWRVKRESYYILTKTEEENTPGKYSESKKNSSGRSSKKSKKRDTHLSGRSIERQSFLRCQLAVSALPISDTDSSCRHTIRKGECRSNGRYRKALSRYRNKMAAMLPTVTCDSAIKRTRKYAQGGTPLQLYLSGDNGRFQFWPTVKSSRGGNYVGGKLRSGYGMTLRDRVMKEFVPTVKGTDYKTREWKGKERKDMRSYVMALGRYSGRSFVPTVGANEYHGAARHGNGSADLKSFMGILPTLTSRDWKYATKKEGNRHASHKNGNWQTNINDIVSQIMIGKVKVRGMSAGNGIWKAKRKMKPVPLIHPNFAEEMMGLPKNFTDPEYWKDIDLDVIPSWDKFPVTRPVLYSGEKIKDRTNRIKACGNAVVPQDKRLILEAIRVIELARREVIENEDNEYKNATA